VGLYGAVDMFHTVDDHFTTYYSISQGWLGGSIFLLANPDDLINPAIGKI